MTRLAAGGRAARPGAAMRLWGWYIVRQARHAGRPLGCSMAVMDERPSELELAALGNPEVMAAVNAARTGRRSDLSKHTTEPPPGDAVFTAELAAMMGVKPGTVKHYVSQASKGWPKGRSRPGFPDPDGRSLIDVASPSTPGQPTRRAWVPWWRRGTVDAFLGRERGERVRDDKGRWQVSGD